LSSKSHSRRLQVEGSRQKDNKKMKRKLEEDDYETQTITVQKQLLLDISRSKLLNLKRTRVVYSMVRRKVIIRNFVKYIFREYQESMKLSQSGN
jgi:hypothetical protein